jgi:ring-1,2-phenylacetyl-CoA epoxidase subunit PaaE
LTYYTIRISEIRRETSDTSTLCFKQPVIRKIKYQAGQYITLIVRINGRKYARPYSFSSAPSVNRELEITVKKVPNGIVSNYICNELKVGDVLEVLEPMGDFTYDNLSSKQTIFLWGVGSGITPLFSIIKEALNAQPNKSIHLTYGNKNQETTIFRNQLSILEQKHTNFSLTNFFSQPKEILENSVDYKGRISAEFVIDLVGQYENIKESLHFICGPKSLKDNIKNSLIELEVPASSILVEEFELDLDPQQLDNVRDSKVTISFQGQQTEIFVSKGKTILDVALDNVIELPYSCQTGNCNTCKAKLKVGQLKMIGLTKERLDLAQDEFLLCCSYPLTSSINIDVI